MSPQSSPPTYPCVESVKQQSRIGMSDWNRVRIVLEPTSYNRDVPSHDVTNKKFDEVGQNFTEDIVSVGASFRRVSLAAGSPAIVAYLLLILNII